MGYKKTPYRSSGLLAKQHRKAEIDRTIEQVLNSPKYKEAVKKQQEQAALRGYCNFCLMACDYLELNHDYAHEGFNNFLDFAAKRLNYVGEDNEQYFQEMNQYFINEFKTDVLGTLGLAIKESEEQDDVTTGSD